jgi:hypothetical protein
MEESMKKIILILGLVMLIASCCDDENHDEERQIMETIKKQKQFKADEYSNSQIELLGHSSDMAARGWLYVYVVRIEDCKYIVFDNTDHIAIQKIEE